VILEVHVSVNLVGFMDDLLLLSLKERLNLVDDFVLSSDKSLYLVKG